nr:uncharacterized protein I303_02936 [Kwoniella dejecticola CBS 10117]OBR86915.1 hypothetical protein I303_02936 [Kwoniella dejecticola CBS 10117]
MFEDDWDFDTYHEDIKDEYLKLRQIHPSLGPFREPRPSDTNTLKIIMLNLRTFMCSYQLAFPLFVDDENGQDQLRRLEEGRNNAQTGKLKRMIDPLLGLSERLARKLRDIIANPALLEDFGKIEDQTEDLGEYFVESESDDGLHMDGWVPEPRSTTSPILAKLRDVDKPSRSSASVSPASSTSTPSKRSSSDEDRSEPVKRSRIVPLELGTQLIKASISSRSFTRTTSAPQRRLEGFSTPLNKSLTIPKSSIKHGTADILRNGSSDSIGTDSTSSNSTTRTNSTVSTPSTPISVILGGEAGGASVEGATNEAGVSSIPITNDTYTAHLNKGRVNFYIQWELERQISQHETVRWGDFRNDDFTRLRGRTAAESASAIAEIIEAVHARSVSKADARMPHIKPIKMTERKALLLSEVDKEEEAILASTFEGVGTERVDWPYGGKIQYVVSVKMTEDGKGCSERLFGPPSLSQENNPYKRGARPFSRSTSLPNGRVEKRSSAFTTAGGSFPFSFILRPPEMPGKSFRLARRFGSRRIVSLKVKDVSSKFRGTVKDMLVGRCLIVLGRPYRALWCTADGEGVMLVEVEESAPEVVTVGRELEPPMPDFLGILRIYNDLTQKPDQAMAKFAARPQILFSDSVPATRVDRAAIGEDDDIVSDVAGFGKATTEQTLTDGCGLMSDSLAQRIFKNPSLTLQNGRPSVVQMRIGGSKGLLALMSPAEAARYPGQEVILRPSMIKALSAKEHLDDPSLLTLDVLRCESLKIGSVLTHEAMIIMVDNGIPIATFLKMAKDQLDILDQDFHPGLLEGETEEDRIIRIVTNCSGRGGVGLDLRKRTARQQAKSLRAVGIDKGYGTAKMVEEDQDDNLLIVKPSERYDVDPISKQPGSIAEALMWSVASGFSPATSIYPAFKLHNLVEDLSMKMTRDFKIPVEQSLTAFIIPDTLQILEPDELFISFSSNGPIDESTQIPMTHLEGDVLAYRSPCKLPTDVRKFRAVYRPELAHLKDCIVLSAKTDKCKRSPASFLGGGDYDGDTVTLVWHHELVRPFRNAPDEVAETPHDFEEQNFDKSVVKGTAFLDTIKDLDEPGQIKEYQKWLLDAVLGDPLTGTYSDLHGNAVYTKALAHPETMRLGRMFCHVLDARKSGLRVKDDVRSNDVRAHGGQLRWRSWKKDKGQEDLMANHWNERELARPRRLGRFIMDELMTEGERYRSAMMGHFLKEPTTLNDQDYRDLSQRWITLQGSNLLLGDAALQEEIVSIERHAKICYNIRQAIVQGRCGDVFQAYRDMQSGQDMKEQPRAGSGNASPTKQQKKIESAEHKLEMLTKTRQLAYIFQNEPTLAKLPKLQFIGGIDNIRQLKLSCLSVVSADRYKLKQVCG